MQPEFNKSIVCIKLCMCVCWLWAAQSSIVSLPAGPAEVGPRVVWAPGLEFTCSLMNRWPHRYYDHLTSLITHPHSWLKEHYCSFCGFTPISLPFLHCSARMCSSVPFAPKPKFPSHISNPPVTPACPTAPVSPLQCQRQTEVLLLSVVYAAQSSWLCAC